MIKSHVLLPQQLAWWEIPSKYMALRLRGRKTPIAKLSWFTLPD